jgi:phage-related protein
MEKPLVWLQGEVKTPPFSKEARLEAGFLLRRLQRGETLGMPASRPMPDVGRACHELRVEDDRRSWRLVYAIEAEAIVILEVFEKRTQKTPKRVLDACKDRLDRFRRVMREERRR